MKPHFICAADALDALRGDLLSGKPPVLYQLGAGELSRIEIGPGLVTLFGGAPGAGKTAFVMQGIIDALRRTSDLRALVCNIEMPPNVLIERQLARLSGVSLSDIRYRRIGAEHADRINQGISTLATIADRLAFVRPPISLANVAGAIDDFEASLLVLDYIQRIAPPGEYTSPRSSIDASMNYLRRFADNGCAVLVVSALSRSKDSNGRSSYNGDGLTLASFRESSELEYGADDAFILQPIDDDADRGLVRLKHLKSRHGKCHDMTLRFDRLRQLFTPPHETQPTRTMQAIAPPKLQAAARSRRSQTAPANGADNE